MGSRPKILVAAVLAVFLVAALSLVLLDCPWIRGQQVGRVVSMNGAGSQGYVLFRPATAKCRFLDSSGRILAEWNPGGRVWSLAGPLENGDVMYALDLGHDVQLVRKSLVTGQEAVVSAYRADSLSEPYWEQYAFYELAVSRDGQWIAYQRRVSNGRGGYSAVIHILDRNGRLIESKGIASPGGGLSWSPDCTSLVAGIDPGGSRGDSRSGEQVTSGQGEHVELWAHTIRDGEWKRLGDGGDPHFAPSGSLLSCWLNGDTFGLYEWPVADSVPRTYVKRGVRKILGMPSENSLAAIVVMEQHPERASLVSLSTEGVHMHEIFADLGEDWVLSMGSDAWFEAD